MSRLDTVGSVLLEYGRAAMVMAQEFSARGWEIVAVYPWWGAGIAGAILVTVIALVLARRSRSARRRAVTRSGTVALRINGRRQQAPHERSESRAADRAARTLDAGGERAPRAAHDRRRAAPRTADHAARRQPNRVRALASGGMPVIEIARSTGLALDAVLLALRLVPPDERQGYPQAAPLAVPRVPAGAVASRRRRA